MSSKRFQVIKDHQSSFPDPIILKKGDKVAVGREHLEEPDWPNWVECKSPDGKMGWAPKQYLTISDDTGIALRDYSGNELNVRVGEEIIVYKTLNGWAWARNSVGQYGWVPLRNIAEI